MCMLPHARTNDDDDDDDDEDDIAGTLHMACGCGIRGKFVC